MPIEILKDLPTPKVGDKVTCLCTYDCVSAFVNHTGTIIDIKSSEAGYRVGVEFDFKFSGGHSCNGHGKPKQCWWFPYSKKYLKLGKAPASKEKIIIYADGNYVIHAKYIAPNGTVVLAKATPQADDEYNFFTGVQVAIHKLMRKCEADSKMVIDKKLFNQFLSNIEVI
jgi:hypothetical protein